MTFLMMVRDADWVRVLLDLAMTRSIATAGWVALLSSIGAAVWSTPAMAVKAAKPWAELRDRFWPARVGETESRQIFEGPQASTYSRSSVL